MSSHRESTSLSASCPSQSIIESCLSTGTLIWLLRPDDSEDLLPTGSESLSILLHVTNQTPHRGRATPPSCIKWWSCVFWERVGPHAIKWSAMDPSTLFYFKILSSSVWKTEGRSVYSGRLGRSFLDFPLKKYPISPESLTLYIQWHVYCRLQ